MRSIILRKLNRAGKRVISLLGALFLVSVNVFPAFASHIPDVTDDWYLDLDAVYEEFNIGNMPFGNRSDVKEWLSLHTDTNEIAGYQFYVNNINHDTVYIYYTMYDVNEIEAYVENNVLYLKNKTKNQVKYITRGFNVNSYQGDLSITSGGTYFNVSSLNAESSVNTGVNLSNYYKIDTFKDIYDASGNKVVDKIIVPEPWSYNVSYSPVLTDELSGLQTIDVTVSLNPSSIKYMEGNYRFDFLPYISSVSASDNLPKSYDNALAVSPYRGYYIDTYTISGGGSWNPNNNHIPGFYNFDKCLGNNIVYSLNANNNYTATVSISIPDTSLVSNTEYYFNVVGIVSSTLSWKGDKEKLAPYRHLFKKLYDDSSGGDMSSWFKESLDYRVLDSSSFTMSSVLKKTSKNSVVTGGLMSSYDNSLNSNPSVITNVGGSGDDLSFSEVDKYNEQQREDYLESAPSASKDFSLAGLVSILDYSHTFISFLSYGFQLIPIQIWGLIEYSIVAVCFVGIIKSIISG